MKRPLIYLSIGFLALYGFVFALPAFAANYTYYRTVTVTSTTSIASGTNTNFPMLFGGTYTWLESTSTGGGAGRIQNLVTAPNGGQEAADLIFVTSTPSNSGGSWSCGTSLPFETESYASSTGIINDWVKVPSLAASQVIYACYGSAAVTTDQSHPSSTFSSYAMVYHLANPNNSISVINSASSTTNLTQQNIATTTGIIDGAGLFNGTTAYATSSATAANATSGEMSVWAKYTGGGFTRGYILDPISGSFGGGGIQENNNGSGVNTFSISIDGSDFAEHTATAAASSTTGLWHYFVGTWANPASNSSSISIYIDGVFSTSTTFAENVLSGGGQDVLAADGNGPGVYANFFLGSLDEVRYINGTVDSPSWILSEYNNQNSPSTFYSVGSEQTAGAGGGSTPLQMFFNWIMSW